MADPALPAPQIPASPSDGSVATPTATAIIEARPSPGGGGTTVSLVASAAAPAGAAADPEPAPLTEFEGMALVSAAAYGCLVTMLWIVIFAIGATVNSQPFRDVLARYATESVGITVAATTPASPAGGEAAPQSPPAASLAANQGDGASSAPAPGASQPQPAAPQTASIGPSPSFVQAALALGVVAVSYTPTNLAVLCSFAALIGCLGQIATVSRKNARARAASQTVSEAKADGPLPPAEPAAKHGASSHGVIPSPVDVTLRNSIGAVTWGFFVYLVVTSGTIVFTGDPFQRTTPEQYIRLAGAASLLAFVVGWRPELLGDLLSKVTASRIGPAPR